MTDTHTGLMARAIHDAMNITDGLDLAAAEAYAKAARDALTKAGCSIIKVPAGHCVMFAAWDVGGMSATHGSNSNG